MQGYVLNKETGNAHSYWDLNHIPVETDRFKFIECAKEDLPEIPESEKKLTL